MFIVLIMFIIIFVDVVIMTHVWNISSKNRKCHGKIQEQPVNQCSSPHFKSSASETSRLLPVLLFILKNNPNKQNIWKKTELGAFVWGKSQWRTGAYVLRQPTHPYNHSELHFRFIATSAMETEWTWRTGLAFCFKQASINPIANYLISFIRHRNK